MQNNLDDKTLTHTLTNYLGRLWAGEMFQLRSGIVHKTNIVEYFINGEPTCDIVYNIVSHFQQKEKEKVDSPTSKVSPYWSGVYQKEIAGYMDSLLTGEELELDMEYEGSIGVPKISDVVVHFPTYDAINIAQQTIAARSQDPAKHIPSPAETPTTNPSEIESTLAERGVRYGSYEEHARVSQNIKRAMQDSNNWADLPDHTKETFEMLAHKIARTLTGDPSYTDNIHDIQGYAKLEEDILLRKQGEKADA